LFVGGNGLFVAWKRQGILRWWSGALHFISCGKYVTNPWSVFSTHFDPSGFKFIMKWNEQIKSGVLCWSL
jgi:hypothetical protein